MAQTTGTTEQQQIWKHEHLCWSKVSLHFCWDQEHKGGQFSPKTIAVKFCVDVALAGITWKTAMISRLAL